MKKCKNCKDNKPLSSVYYHVNSNHVDGYTSNCKDCENAISRERYKRLGSEYLAWKNMLSRCTNENSTRYKNWGGRGISVCERWLNSSDDFIKDMGKKPSEFHSLDRIDNDEDYTPENCKWSTWEEQNANQRKRHDNKSGCTGVYSKGLNGWFASIERNYKRYHLGSFDKFEDAVNARKEAEQRHLNGEPIL